MAKVLLGMKPVVDADMAESIVDALMTGRATPALLNQQKGILWATPASSAKFENKYKEVRNYYTRLNKWVQAYLARLVYTGTNIGLRKTITHTNGVFYRDSAKVEPVELVKMLVEEFNKSELLNAVRSVVK